MIGIGFAIGYVSFISNEPVGTLLGLVIMILGGLLEVTKDD